MKNLTTVSRFLVLGVVAFAGVAVSGISQAFPKPYGAIAYSASDGMMGISTKNVNREAAEQEAMGMCAVINNGANCKIVVYFHNACAAISLGSNGVFGADWAITTPGDLMPGINAAHQRARYQCQGDDGVDCQLLQAVCSFQDPE